MKSLNEVGKIVGLERRAIQEYEKCGLAVKPATRNKYGHLLYDTPEIERLWQLKFYKECGYNMTDIRKLQENGELDGKTELERVTTELKKKREQIDNLILIAEVMTENSIQFNTLRSGLIPECISNDISSDDILGMMGASLRISNSLNDERYYREDDIFDKDFDEVDNLLDTMVTLRSNGVVAKDDAVQIIVASIHNILSGILSNSMIIFQSVIDWFAADLEEDYGKEGADFIISAIQYYCTQHKFNQTDEKFLNALNNIESLARNRKGFKSGAVQNEIRTIHTILAECKGMTEVGIIEWLRSIGNIFGSQAYKNFIDNGAQRGVAWFMSKAIEFYLNNLEGGEATNDSE